MNVSPVSNATSWPVWWPEDERLRGTMAASHAALVQAMAAAGLRQRPRLHLAQGPGGEGPGDDHADARRAGRGGGPDQHGEKPGGLADGQL
jgi:hypothetical protein